MAARPSPVAKTIANNLFMVSPLNVATRMWRGKCRPVTSLHRTCAGCNINKMLLRPSPPRRAVQAALAVASTGCFFRVPTAIRFQILMAPISMIISAMSASEKYLRSSS